MLTVTRIIRRDARDAEYRELLTSLSQFTTQVGVVDGSRGKSFSGVWPRLMEILTPDLLESYLTDTWPGTRILDRVERLYKFRLTPSVLAALFDHSNAISDWVSPAMPQDIHFLREDGSVVLGSSGSRNRFWIELTEAEWAAWELSVSTELALAIETREPIPGEVRPLVPLLGPKIGEPPSVDELAPLVGALDDAMRQQIGQYLRSGHAVFRDGASSPDVLDEDVSFADGSDVLTDGVWVWRRDASDYVDKYGIRIPTEALDHFTRQRWVVPELAESQLEDIEEFVWDDL